MAKLLDTNIILDDPNVLNETFTEPITITEEVFGELNKHKSDKGTRGYAAREALRIIANIVLSQDVEVGGKYTNPVSGTEFLFNTRNTDLLVELFGRCDYNIAIQSKCSDNTLQTSDLGLAVLAKLLGGNVEHKILKKEPYTGACEYYTDRYVVDSVASRAITESPEKFHSNQFVYLIDKTDPDHKTVGRYDAAHNALIPIQYKMRAYGVEPRPKNMEQTMFMNLLMNPEIRIITASSQAGGGKTLLSLAAGLEQMEGKKPLYSKIMMFRALSAVSEDIGFLPGDAEEKVDRWYDALYDSFEFILMKNNMVRDTPTREYMQQQMFQHNIEIGILTYIRGRSIPNTYIIVDEAQNIEPDVMRSIMTRVGSGSKIIIIGDPSQRDNPKCSKEHNGLTHVINAFYDKEEPIYAHIELQRCERDPIAELAIKYL